MKRRKKNQKKNNKSNEDQFNKWEIIIKKSFFILKKHTNIESVREKKFYKSKSCNNLWIISAKRSKSIKKKREREKKTQTIVVVVFVVVVEHYQNH